MKITVLGSGTAAPVLKRNMSGYLLETRNKKILFDSGAGTIRQLLKNKTSLLDISHIFYTHLHNDHVNDLPAILWSNNYGALRNKPLHLFGPKGFKKYYRTLTKKILKTKLYYDASIQEMKGNSIVILSNNKKTASRVLKNNNFLANEKIKIKSKNVLIKSIKSKHTESSVSYRIEHNGKSIVYSGDTDYSENIIDISKNADVILLECSFLKKIEGHLTPELCGKIARQSNAKKLVLTHFYPECDKADVKKLCRKEFAGRIVLARDFMKLRV